MIWSHPITPFRLIDALIDKIITQDTGFFDHLAPQSSVGRRGYSAAALIKLYMYGYIHGINSSRKLEAEATRNIEVIWLLSGLKPSYKTIADYRRDYPEQIRRVNEKIVRFLADQGWIDGKRIGIDGTKLKAYTGWDMADEQGLDRRLAAARTQLEVWLAELVTNDLADELDESAPGDPDDGQPAGESQLMEHIARLRQKVEHLEGLKEELDRQQIHAYIHGQLSPQEEDQLWVEFVKEPHWYDIFETELLFTHFAKNAEKDFESYFPLVE